MSKTLEDNLEKLLSKLINHKLVLSYTPHEEGDLRETYGVLKDFNKDIVHMELYDDYGELESNYYLNRHGCTLHSIIDYGEK